MASPDKVMQQSVDDAHVSPIYFWQLNFFLLQSGVRIRRIATNEILRKPRWIKRMVENVAARIIRRNIRKRHFPDCGVSPEAVLFGDCLVFECVKDK